MHDRAKIKFSGLAKRYGDGKIAVTNLATAMLEGQITCLLGHNGAGKSTTISMLTGMTSPSSGVIEIYGRDHGQELSAIRQDIGICPQQNVLFPSLTVSEVNVLFWLFEK